MSQVRTSTSKPVRQQDTAIQHTGAPPSRRPVLDRLATSLTVACTTPCRVDPPHAVLIPRVRPLCLLGCRRLSIHAQHFRSVDLPHLCPHHFHSVFGPNDCFFLCFFCSTFTGTCNAKPHLPMHSSDVHALSDICRDLCPLPLFDSLPDARFYPLSI